MSIFIEGHTIVELLQVTPETRTEVVHILETQRLKLLPFTLELKKATLAEMLEVEIPSLMR